MALLERAIFDLWGDVTFIENRVPPPVTSCHLFGVPPSLPLRGDVIYGWSLKFHDDSSKVVDLLSKK